MRKITSIIIISMLILGVVLAVSVSAVDLNNEESLSLQETRVSYDVGSYSSYYVDYSTDYVFPRARYKRASGERHAAHRFESLTRYYGGFAYWNVYCVSDGCIATNTGIIIDTYVDENDHVIKKNTVGYEDDYGTTGYTNRLHIINCGGSMSCGMTITNGTWCPDEGGIANVY